MKTNQCPSYIGGHNLVVTPGLVLRCWMDVWGITRSEAAKRLGLCQDSLDRIVKEKSGISYRTAANLARVTGVRRELWMEFDRQRAERDHYRRHGASYWTRKIYAKRDR